MAVHWGKRKSPLGAGFCEGTARCPANTGGSSACVPGFCALHTATRCLQRACRIALTFGSHFVLKILDAL